MHGRDAVIARGCGLGPRPRPARREQHVQGGLYIYELRGAVPWLTNSLYLFMSSRFYNTSRCNCYIGMPGFSL